MWDASQDFPLSVLLQTRQHSPSPSTPFVMSTLLFSLCVLTGTSFAGFLSKKSLGFNEIVWILTGITGKTSTLGLWVDPKVCQTVGLYCSHQSNGEQNLRPCMYDNSLGVLHVVPPLYPTPYTSRITPTLLSIHPSRERLVIPISRHPEMVIRYSARFAATDSGWARMS